jgi:hypothetical protein
VCCLMRAQPVWETVNGPLLKWPVGKELHALYCF